MRILMPTKRCARLSGLGLAVLLISSAVHFVRAQESPAPAAAMPGMEMPAPSQDRGTNRPTPPGYSEISVSPDVQQRIGVALGAVQRMPLTMNIRTVGIVRPNETK